MNNNECGGGAVCLVESGVSGVCVCPPLEASRIETDSQGVQHYNCARKLLQSVCVCVCVCVWVCGGGGG